MTEPCLVVLTARGRQTIINETGSQAWRLKPENAKKLKYCVCVQNRLNGHWGGADQPHHQAFMIGRIKDVVTSSERPDRYLVIFDEYANISYPDAWPGLRNPVRYGNLAEFGVDDPNALTWLPMPSEPTGKPASRSAQSGDADEDRDGFGPLTIPEAKAGLALGLGVPEAAIEITVRF